MLLLKEVAGLAMQACDAGYQEGSGRRIMNLGPIWPTKQVQENPGAA